MRFELRAAVQEPEFDHEQAAGDGAAELVDEAAAGLHRAARREQIVHQEHAVAGADGVLVDFQAVGSVLKLVGRGVRLPGELSVFPDRIRIGCNPLLPRPRCD